jgi:hypothetical protein
LADLESQSVRYFGVTGNGLNPAGVGTCPQGVGVTLALQVAPVAPKVPQKFIPLHPTATSS